jgi:Radical SAM superfamily
VELGKTSPGRGAASSATATGSLSPVLHVVLRESGAALCGSGGAPHLPLRPPDIALLSALARNGSQRLADVCRDIAQVTNSDPAELGAFVGTLRQRTLLIDATAAEHRGNDDAAHALAPVAQDRCFTDDDILILATPIVFRVTARGYEHLDHDGRLLAQLEAPQFAAAAELGRPIAKHQAFERHRTQTAAIALDLNEYDLLLARLAGAGLLDKFDGRRFGGRGDVLGRAAMLQRKKMADAVESAVNAHEQTERAREKATGTTRVRVVPIDQVGSPLPLGLGMIVAYAMAFDGGRLQESFQFVPEWVTGPRRLPRYAKAPAVFLFSNYIWSHGKNLAISERLKKLNPRSVTIHGGPDTPKYEGDVDAYFEANPHVDVAVHGEGEATAAAALAALAAGIGDGPPDLSVLRGVAGLSFRDGVHIVRNPDRERFADLNVIPSPYLMGLFNAHAAAGETMAVVETNRGCPYGCTFCDWGSATLSRIRKFDMERVYAELEWCAKRNIDRIFLADANFGILERDVEIAEMVARLKRQYGYPKLFSTNYAKNTCKHLHHIIETLAGAGIITTGLLSLQSMDTGTLDTVHRSNIKVEKYEDLAREFRRAKLPLFVDLMLGLPGATPESFQNDLQACIDREVTAKIYQTELLVNSPMNDPAYREQHKIQASAPHASLVASSRGPDGSTRRSLVISTASFSAAEYDDMLHSRRSFLVFENLGVLRQVARFVRHETGTLETVFYQQVQNDEMTRPDLWPALAFAVEGVPFLGTPPVSWKLFIDEVRRYVTTVFDVLDDTALETVLAVQHSLLPARGRTFPVTVPLKHDYAAWHRAVLDAKDAGHRDDWGAHVPHLREYGSGSFLVDDPHDVCSRGIGYQLDDSGHADWELGSPVARPTAGEHLGTG